MPPFSAPRPSHPSRRAVLAGAAAACGAGALAVRSAGAAPAFPASDATHAFDVAIDAGAAGTPVNRRILGSNVGWVFGGDGILQPSGDFAPNMLDMARKLAPTVLRYPGGTFSDMFHWEAAQNEHVFSRRKMPTLMDTQRFLELCEAVGAEPLITVNIVTGTAQEAARWLHATNVAGLKSRISGRMLPKVRFWELGNEPYLQEQSRKDIDLLPAEFARRVNLFIDALRSVDPDILIGLPLTSDTRAGLPVTPYQGFTRQVLGRVDKAFDYACLHNAYMPFGYRRGMTEAGLYWGAAAGALTVQSDFAAMSQLLRELRPGRKLPLAVTEYSALFSLGRGATDNWITTPAGAIYLADVLRVFSQTPELLLATHWSLSANWLFGAIHANGHARPAYQVLRLMGEALHGQLLPARVQAQTVRVEGIGQVAAVDAMPLVEVLATRSPPAAAALRTLRLFLINKDPQRAAVGTVALGSTKVQPAARATLSVLSALDVLNAHDQPNAMARTESVPQVQAGQVQLHLPPHSVALLTIEIPTT
ncbi:MAG: hypothetical protein JSS56_26235 [Proteobacteria bacterium]|nr:hypothetical protein [Pseudomonadota bacterium]